MLLSSTETNNQLKVEGYFRTVSIGSEERNKILFVLIGILAFALMNLYFNPLKFIINSLMDIDSPNGCPLLTFTGIPCLTCGMGRAFSCLTDGDIKGSTYRNPLFILFFTVSSVIYVLLFSLALNKRKILIEKKAWLIILFFLMMIWIANIIFGNHH
ncbi:MAG: DUF2752 domain-containing protein [Ignavibacteria bacterium]|nr:DUF2752 domain-containing protein [Ignavibacteria bacterium]